MVPTKLAKDPFSTVPVMLILIPISSVSTVASPPIFNEPGSILNAESASIWASRFPWTGPTMKAPEPDMVYVPPLSITETLIKKAPPGPSTVPVRLFKDPASTVPAIFILNPATSVLTAAVPPIFKEEGSILKAESVSIWAFKLPWIGPALKAPSPVIVYVPPLSTTEALIKYDWAGPTTVPKREESEPSATVPERSIWLPAISWLKETSPPIFSDDGSILKAESVCISALKLPWRGPAVKAPSPEIK